MRKSDNYGLNLVEGSDIVNPLVQDVPNYEIIDVEMAKNANAGVPLATELLTGTVHALTRDNPNAPMFRFVATANFKTGDTFTVDGVQVTALLTSGEPLATGCYVINSNVICCLVGTVLTMFCSNSLAEVHAIDSDKLGGESPEYYGKATDVVAAINLAQNANQISLSNRENISELTVDVTNLKNKTATELSGVIDHGAVTLAIRNIKRKGDVVNIALKVSGQQSINSTATVVGIVPEGFRPKTTSHLMGSGTYDAKQWLSIPVTINPNGEIKLDDYASNTMNFTLYGCYLCD